ncbi:MAG: glycine--tRNA ligase subunit beta [Hyphomonadaceae bacterium]|nr:glycine--tRNA ligase subunit beta [Hyphomonadaceae bacterium]
MPQLIIEFFSEEIPARMQKRAEEDLAKLLKEKLAGLATQSVRTFSTPRRLTIVVDGLPARTPDVREERKGPRVGAPDQALQGFLRGAGLTSIDQAKVQNDPKGDFYVALIEKPGRSTPDLLKAAIPEIVRAFPWPKSMRSGEGDVTWVRPLQNIACVFDGAEIGIDIENIPSKAETRGHRFHAPDAFAITDFESYAAQLRKAHVILDREERKAIILRDTRKLCEAKGLTLVEDPGLLEEVAGLAEWPVALLGEMDKAFLALPSEVIRLAMRTHQKYFAVRKGDALAPHFIVVANIDAHDGGAAIAAGNARVLSARLNDARFFWDVDRFYDAIDKKKRRRLRDEAREKKLRSIVFHQKLGSVWDKVERVAALAKELCAVTGADPALVEKAAHLCKMDLVTETVGEFPELQGQIGRLLYLEENNAPSPFAGEGREGARADASTAPEKREHKSSNAAQADRPPPPTPSPQGGGGASSAAVESIAAAIEDHYRPLGPNDRVPSDKVAITLALADKLDTLVAFWVIGEKPTGSSDAYGLRRAALGEIRVLLESRTRLALLPALMLHEKRRANVIAHDPQGRSTRMLDLLAFLADRLTVQLRDQGKRHDLVDAVFSLGDDDLVRIVARVEALDAFLKTQDGSNLLAGYKRSANILRAEERKDDKLSTVLQTGEYPQQALFQENAEKTLHAALSKAAPAARAAVEKEDFTAAMSALSSLRAPVDAFFEAVLVNADDPKLRLNRLALLTNIRDALHEVADFSRIEG